LKDNKKNKMKKNKMKRFGAFSLAILFWVFLARGEKSHSSERVEKPWNFVVILLDDAGWHDLGFTGNDFIETPHLDQLASEGVQFTHAYATHPFCAPTRQSIMSGQYPVRTAWTKKSELKNDVDQIEGPAYSPAGSHKWTKKDPGITGLAEKLKSKGYATGHIGKFHFSLKEGNFMPEKLGFDYNFGGHPMVGAVKNFFAPFEGLPGNVKSKPGEYLTERLTNETISYIERNQNKPFYVQLWHYAPHAPIMAPADVVEKYTIKMQEKGFQNVNPTYAAMIDVIDQGVGKIIARLRELGLEERTIIIMASDNGGVKQFGSVPVTSMYPLRGEKGVTYEGGIRIPMVIKVPGVTNPGVCSDKFVSVVDLYPTILDFAGVAISPGQVIDGYSLKPLLSGENQNELNDRLHVWYNPTHGVKDHNGEIFQPVAVIQKGHWKLIRQFNHRDELYHLKNDPSESVNLTKYVPQVHQRMASWLDSCLETSGISLPKPNPHFDPDYLLARQVPNDFVDHLKVTLVKTWDGKTLAAWQANNACEATAEADCLRMHALATYPKISSERINNAGEGTFLVKIKLKITVPGGRIRFDWAEEERGNGVIELFPERNGEWEEFTGIFKTRSALRSIGLAGPTHLGALGFYNSNIDPNYMDVKSIELYTVVADY
jgi:arylsulfatase A-like enzyme